MTFFTAITPTLTAMCSIGKPEATRHRRLLREPFVLAGLVIETCDNDSTRKNCLSTVGSVVLPLHYETRRIGKYSPNPTTNDMKSVLRLFALMTVFFMGSMGSADAATKLKYDFVTKHPAANIRIDDGFREVRGSYAYWSGTWAGLFGNKIAFATDSYPVLRSVGGLVDYHSSRKMYLMNLSVGDQLAIYYGGDNPNVQFHNSASARLTGVTTQ